MTTTCTCCLIRPTRDEAYVCESCLDTLGAALGDCAWLGEELETSVTRQRGVDYSRGASGKGGRKARDRPLPASQGPAGARDHLRAVLVSWVRFCEAGAVRSSDHRPGLPADTLEAMSRWLLWRVDGLGLHELGAHAVDEIGQAVDRARRAIDSPPERQYLGVCPSCGGGLWTSRGSAWARCANCGQQVDAATIRDQLLTDLEDRLVTAAEAARLITGLGIATERDALRRRINTWHRRGRIEAVPAISDDPVFRFGTVRQMLAEDQGRRHAAS